MIKKYDENKWLYVPNYYTDYRYILGTRGENPLICIGINPSTAEPDNLDNTLKSVERIALSNGFDSFIMFNVYAQRATDPNDMDLNFDENLHCENMREFENLLLSMGRNAQIWAAWGTIINKRSYLKECLSAMVKIGEKCGVSWKKVGKLSKDGHPHHPLYLKKDSPIEEFDIKQYIDSLN